MCEHRLIHLKESPFENYSVCVYECAGGGDLRKEGRKEERKEGRKGAEKKGRQAKIRRPGRGIYLRDKGSD